MKRFLLLFCTVVLVCSIMVVPAFAAESYSFTVDNWYADGIFPPYGEYEVSIVTSEFTCTFPDQLVYNANSLVIDGEHAYLYFESTCPEHDIDIVSDISFDLYEGEYMPGLFPVELYYDSTNEEFNPWPYTLILTPVSSEPEPEPVTGSIVDGVAQVFGGVGTWIAGQLGTATSLFWNASTGTLTFLGVLGVAALALAVILLLAFVVVRFLRFRG